MTGAREGLRIVSPSGKTSPLRARSYEHHVRANGCPA
jgi:hypothetical protein